jgi:hypothetical protein
LKVTIQNKSLGYAIGKNEDSELVLIKNGDLLNKTEAEVVFINNSDKWIISEIEETFQNSILIESKSDEEGLISTKEITQVINRNIFLIKDKFVFPSHRIYRIVEYILDKPELWDSSKLSLSDSRSAYAAAMKFGISFQKAMIKLQNSGFQKARLYCEHKQNFLKEGVVAEMLANIYLDREKVTNIEIWQGVEGTNEVFYGHGIIKKETTSFSHFDCAIINYDLKDREELFRENKKIKGDKYQKQYRIDGEINQSEIFEIANKFFPLDKLIDEFFEIERIE